MHPVRLAQHRIGQLSQPVRPFAEAPAQLAPERRQHSQRPVLNTPPWTVPSGHAILNVTATASAAGFLGQNRR